jgi:hypothetical protein
MTAFLDFVLRSDAHFAGTTMLVTLAIGIVAVLLTPGGDR